MSLAHPNDIQFRPRARPLPIYTKERSMRTQWIRFEPDQLANLETELGAPLAFLGTLQGRPVRVVAVESARGPNHLHPQAGHWQDNLLAWLDAAARSMIQVGLETFEGTWDFRAGECVAMDVRIGPANDIPETPSTDTAPRARNRLRR